MSHIQYGSLWIEGMAKEFGRIGFVKDFFPI
jgi:hypothetical protein